MSGNLEVASLPTGFLIGGQWRAGTEAKAIEAIDPSSGAVIISVTEATVQDALDAVAATKKASKGWAVTLHAKAMKSCASASSQSLRTEKCWGNPSYLRSAGYSATRMAKSRRCRAVPTRPSCSISLAASQCWSHQGIFRRRCGLFERDDTRLGTRQPISGADTEDAAADDYAIGMVGPVGMELDFKKWSGHFNSVCFSQSRIAAPVFCTRFQSLTGKSFRIIPVDCGDRALENASCSRE